MGAGDGLERCPWVDLSVPEYVAYHDEEWGVPVHDDRRHFELLTLEGAQAGLSWLTVLRKREGYRRVFAGFEASVVAGYGAAEVERIVADPGVVRHRGKVESTVGNARRFCEVQEAFGSFDAYVWGFVGGEVVVNRFEGMEDYPATSAESEALGRDLKARGFRFVGPTTCYAYMQAVGMVDDHVVGCAFKKR